MRMREVVISAALFIPVESAVAGGAMLPDGAFEIVARLELPHVERWAVDRTTTVCLSGATDEGGIPIPVLSANNPFAECAAANVVVSGTSFAYDIICPDRASAKAHASYTLAQGGFSGRVAMVMAAKNMTMTEVVRGRRLGACEPQRQEAEGNPRDARRQ
jgi:hypothetical protein